MERQTFHETARKVLFITQLFGLLPVSNMLARNVSQLQYKWLSIPTFYTFLVIVLNVIEFGTFLRMLIDNGLSFHSSGTLSLFVICTLEHVYFWRLATKWPRLMQQWRQVEELFLKAPYNQYVNFNMKHWLYFWYILIMSCGSVEHCFLLYNSFHKSELERVQCHLNISHWESLYGRERPYLRSVLKFEYWFLPFLEWLNLTLAYPRSFTDVFIIIISIGMACRFRQLLQRIQHVEGKTMPTMFWTETREHYLVLKKLMRILNAEISPLILLACANNMYFICFQLFNSFNNIGVDWVAEFAFWFSLLYNIARTMLTFYLAALVDEYTKKIISCLRDIPSRSWCMETLRFSEQLSVDVTAFSGSGFFSLTRTLILAMASTVVTYELMVINVINQGSIKQITDYCSKYIEYNTEEINEENSEQSS